jgi:hypothetical protein
MHWFCGLHTRYGRGDEKTSAPAGIKPISSNSYAVTLMGYPESLTYSTGMFNFDASYNLLYKLLVEITTEVQQK